MSAVATAEAINAVSALLTVSLRAADAVKQINTIVSTAQSEGRDLNAAEIVQVRSLRKEAMQRWDALPANSGDSEDASG